MALFCLLLAGQALACDPWSLLYDSQREALLDSIRVNPDDYAIILRHADIIPTSDFDKEPQAYQTMIPEYCSGTTPPLSEKGLVQARQVNEGLAKNSLTPDQVVTSPVCRALQTANTAFGAIDIIETADMELRMPNEPRNISLRNRINDRSGNGLTVLVSHSLQIKNATSIEPACGEALIVQKSDNAQKSTCLARILPDEWLSPQDYMVSDTAWEAPASCAADAVTVRTTTK